MISKIINVGRQYGMEEVLRMVGETELKELNTILKRRRNWIGPILQKEYLVHNIVKGKSGKKKNADD